MNDIFGTRYISFCNTDKVFKVTKRIKGSQKYLGCSKTLIGALMIRDWCEANDWQKYPKVNTKSTEPYIRVQEKADPSYRYRVAKVINGREYSFGSFPTLNQAKECRDNCIKHRWNLDLIPSNPLRFIQPIIRKDGTIKYGIYHKKNGVTTHYGLFNTIPDAMQERDLLEKYEWDMDVICESLDMRVDNTTLFLGRVMYE